MTTTEIEDFEHHLKTHFRKAVKAVNTRHKDWKKIAVPSVKSYINQWFCYLITSETLSYLNYELNVERIGQRTIRCVVRVKPHPYECEQTYDLTETVWSPNEVYMSMLAVVEDASIKKHTNMLRLPTGLLSKYL